MATGMRPEEAAGLQVRDIDLENGFLRIRRVYVESAQAYESKAKNDQSRREVELDTVTTAALRGYLDRHHDRATRWFTDNPDHLHPGTALPLFVGVGKRPRGYDGPDTDRLNFSKPMSHRWFYMRHWKATVAVCKLPDDLRFYDLRHAHISWLVANVGQPGALSIKEISERVGHSSAVMTLDRYAHSPKDNRDRAKKALGSLLAQSEAGNVVPLVRSTSN
ncbi:MAG TPA: site-specific integrase [Nocardioidaceae bacterium]|nr:site-specific integrase [Nocardioidaceae bacterium]